MDIAKLRLTATDWSGSERRERSSVSLSDLVRLTHRKTSQNNLKAFQILI